MSTRLLRGAEIIEASLLQELSNARDPAVVDSSSVLSLAKSFSYEETFNNSVADAYPRLPLALFYNAFVPPNGSQREINHALDIVREQILQLRESFAATEYSLRSDKNNNGITHEGSDQQKLHVYYNTIGHPNTVTPRFMKKLCSIGKSGANLTCTHMKHYQAGNYEQVTLKRAYEYCLKYPDRSIIYIHSKGSFNQHKEWNVGWRKVMLDAVTGRDCIVAVTTSRSECNLCGNEFAPIWSTLMFGNFFVATCDYVKKLIDPMIFHEFIDAVEKRRDKDMERGMFLPHQKGLFVLGRSNFTSPEGIRYSAEEWIGSHPSVIPCDKASGNWSLAPSRGFMHNWVGVRAMRRKRMLKIKSLRMREYTLLGGRIQKWLMLYNETPPLSSWAWDWYPDGEEWRRGVELYDKRVVDVLTSDDYLSCVYNSCLLR
jgi:hypothetical protein